MAVSYLLRAPGDKDGEADKTRTNRINDGLFRFENYKVIRGREYLAGDPKTDKDSSCHMNASEIKKITGLRRAYLICIWWQIKTKGSGKGA